MALIIIGALRPVRMADLFSRTSRRAALHGVAPKMSVMISTPRLSGNSCNAAMALLMMSF
ncbi:Uncharacterised protein [Mycobacteroides abscessus subsp. massiliense]|nr:Uncharacterised protein [Mycobacteroides abscessus subsp. massiliense]